MKATENWRDTVTSNTDDAPKKTAALYAPDALFWGTVSEQVRDTPQHVYEYFVSYICTKDEIPLRCGSKRAQRQEGNARIIEQSPWVICIAWARARIKLVAVMKAVGWGGVQDRTFVLPRRTCARITENVLICRHGTRLSSTAQQLAVDAAGMRVDVYIRRHGTTVVDCRVLV